VLFGLAEDPHAVSAVAMPMVMSKIDATWTRRWPWPSPWRARCDPGNFGINCSLLVQGPYVKRRVRGLLG
jgi:hypothetical protein